MISLLGHKVGPGEQLFVLAGPDIIEGEEMVLRHAARVKEICGRLSLPFAFKCSFDKANRTSGSSFRGPGLTEGMRILSRVKREIGVAILTDVHDLSQVEAVADVADIIQVPAFLCRQTDLVEAVARTGRGVNLKKGQFVAPKDIVHSARKAFEAGNPNVLVTERGASFGYNNLVVDMRSFALMREAGLSTCFDATHSVQLPSSAGGTTGGERKFVPLLARAAAAAGIDALFTEVHEDPDNAKCDGPCSLTFEGFEQTLKDVLAIRRVLAPSRVNPTLAARAAQVELLVVDVDGVLTDGGLHYGPEGELLKVFNVKDGHGLVMARLVGLKTAILTARKSAIVEKRGAELGVTAIRQGAKFKGPALEALCAELGVALENTAYMGDDTNDLPALKRVGLPAAPADAVDDARAASLFVSQRTGGQGAVRELVELCLKSSGRWERALLLMEGPEKSGNPG